MSELVYPEVGPARSTDHIPSAVLSTAVEWSPLIYFSVYRVALACLLAVLGLWQRAPRPLGEVDADLFSTVTMAYLGFSVLAVIATRLRHPRFGSQVPIQVFVDIFALTLLMHASGGVTSGFGMLLVVAIAGGSMLSGGRVAILFAAIAALVVLAEQVYTGLRLPWVEANYPHAGMLGAAFFATAFIAHTTARRLRASEALAARQEVDLADLGRLNEHIVQRMHAGIVVVGEDGRVRLSNKSANRMLGLTSPENGALLSELVPELGTALVRWNFDQEHSTFLVHPVGTHIRVQVSFAALATGRDGAVIFLEDSAAMAQRVQQLKLASLGRLAASIAHEIRNPLSAVTHANALLRESDSLNRGDRRLTQIVDDNARRMNDIVESVLRMSRRTPSDPKTFELRDWLSDFVAEFTADVNLQADQVHLEVEPANLRVRVDIGQFRQVVRNLCENGLQHVDATAPELKLRAGIAPDSRRPYLDIVDNGGGVPEAAVDQIFEPFFTTRPIGSGLGLFVARELCEANQATLDHRPSDEGCCFRITFSDPRRQGVVAA